MTWPCTKQQTFHWKCTYRKIWKPEKMLSEFEIKINIKSFFCSPENLDIYRCRYICRSSGPFVMKRRRQKLWGRARKAFYAVSGRMYRRQRRHRCYKLPYTSELHIAVSVVEKSRIVLRLRPREIKVDDQSFHQQAHVTSNYYHYYCLSVFGVASSKHDGDGLAYICYHTHIILYCVSPVCLIYNYHCRLHRISLREGMHTHSVRGWGRGCDAVTTHTGGERVYKVAQLHSLA